MESAVQVDNLQFVPTYDIDVAAKWLDNGLVLIALEALDDHLVATNEQRCEIYVSTSSLCHCLVHQCGGSESEAQPRAPA